MKACPNCKGKFDDCHTSCPDCYVLLRELAKESIPEQAARFAAEDMHTPFYGLPAGTESILAEALRITQGDRHASYGVPLDNHQCTADLVTAWLRRRYGAAVPLLTAEDICMMNILQKCAREANTPKRDNLVDIAGYAANAEMCMAERGRRAGA